MKVSSSAGTAKVSVIRRVELDYYLVTGDKPLEFSVSGPDWLRVYTRLWLPPQADSECVYRMSLWQDDVERPLEFRTRRSSSSFGPGQHPVGRWRSFFIQVPEGENRYRLALTQAPGNTVGVRLAFQKPAVWRPATLSGLKELTLVQAGNRERLFELPAGRSTDIELSGPCRVKIRVRLSYSTGMQGAQNFVLLVTEQDKDVARKNLRVTRSALASYENLPDAVPSNESSIRLTLGEGAHRLAVLLSGTLARSAGVAVETIAGEKYE